MTAGKVRQYPYFVGLFHTFTPLRSVELSKEWQRVHDGGKVRQYPYFARLLHTSTPPRSVELSKKWRNSGFHGQGWTWLDYSTHSSTKFVCGSILSHKRSCIFSCFLFLTTINLHTIKKNFIEKGSWRFYFCKALYIQLLYVQKQQKKQNLMPYGKCDLKQIKMSCKCHILILKTGRFAPNKHVSIFSSSTILSACNIQNWAVHTKFKIPYIW